MILFKLGTKSDDDVKLKKRTVKKLNSMKITDCVFFTKNTEFRQ